MLVPKDLHSYQRECILHLLYNNDSMLWLQMGLGKTIITLTAIVDRMRAGQIKKTIIFGPLRVIESVWETESRKWSHTKHLRFSILRGNNEKRIRSLFTNVDVILVNYELMNWLAETLSHYYVDQDKEIPFQAIVYDEVSKMKNSTSLRVSGGKRDRKDKQGVYQEVKIKGWRPFINMFKYRIGLTGTPASNGYIDLHGQYLAVDGGQRIGEYITHFRDMYFSKSYDGWSYSITDIGKDSIERSINDITKKMDAKDYLDVPEVITTNIMVDLPSKFMKRYLEIEKNMFTQLDSGTEIEVFNKASLSNKCLQFCNGAAYLSPDSREWEELHDIKLEALADVLEEASGSPVLCSYSFQSDAERIMKYFKKYKPVNLTAEPSRKTSSIIKKWNEGKIKLLIGHPASMGHGIDGLQQSGSIIVWFGINWSLEYYDQMNGRLNRMGQEKPVSIIRILCRNTVDLAVEDAIHSKTNTQEGLKKALDRYRRNSVKIE